jgi:L-2,4-diaminobutyrate decarboxylase
MDPTALAAAADAVQRDGGTVMAVVATAGTTDFGAVDPLPAIADVCEQHGWWLHVDAAYGGGLVTSHRHRHRLDGVSRADSVAVDFHKTFFQPVACSALLVADARSLAAVGYHADYLNPADDDAEDLPHQVGKSLQTTRRFDALKLWLTLRAIGPDRIGEMLDAVLDLAQQGWEILERLDDFEVVCRPSLSTLVFRWRPAGLDEQTASRVNRAARHRMFGEGAALVASTRVGGRDHLKVTLLNPLATVDDLLAMLEAVRRHARAALADHCVDAR